MNFLVNTVRVVALVNYKLVLLFYLCIWSTGLLVY